MTPDIPDLPQSIGRYYYPGAKDHGEDGLWLAIIADGAHWAGVFAAGKGGHSGIYSMPNPEYFMVVSSGRAFIVNSRNPTDYDDRMHTFIESAFVHEIQRKLIILGFSDVIIYSDSEQGSVWEELPAQWDGIKIDGMDDDGIFIRGWNPVQGQYEKVYLNLRVHETKWIGNER